MRTLITGATGLVGGCLARALLARGERVRVFVRPTSNPGDLASRGAEVVTGRIEQPGDVRRAVAGADRVYHLAAVFRTAGHSDRYYDEVNVGGTENVVSAAERYGVSRTIHCSTIGVHGDVREIPCTEDSPMNPGDVYQRSKLMGEVVAREAFARGLPGVVVRPASVYGPGDTRFLKLFRSIQKRTFRMIGDGRTLLHPVFIDDLIAGLLLCGEREGAIGRTFVLAGPNCTPLDQLVSVVADAVGVPPPRGRLPVWPFVVAGAACEAVCIPLGLEPPLHRRRVHFFTKNRAFTIERAQRLLGYQPKVAVAEGVLRTAAWYMERGLLRTAGRAGALVERARGARNGEIDHGPDHIGGAPETAAGAAQGAGH